MKVVIYGKEGCGFCRRAKKFCENEELAYEYYSLGTDVTKEDIQKAVGGEFPTYPQILVDGEPIGGYTELFDRVMGL